MDYNDSPQRPVPSGKGKRVAQSKILLDSNSYFRLGRSIHPLLFQEFGNERYCLYVLKELDDEYERNPRLKSKFAWVNEAEYRENRSKRLSLTRTQRNTELPSVYEFIWNHVLTAQPGPSPIDVKALSYGYVLRIPVVTDDGDMRAVADTFGIGVWSTLKLLKLMLDNGHIGMATVRQVAAYWSYEQDLPAGFAGEYRRLFDEAPPA